MPDSSRLVDPGPIVEAAAFVAGLSAVLRRTGLPNSPDRAAWLAEALRMVPPTSRDSLHSTCRAVFVTSREQATVFDAAFSAVFDGLLDPADARGDPNAPLPIGSEPSNRLAPVDPRSAGNSDHVGEPRPAAPGPAGNSVDDQDAHERDALLEFASSEESLHETSFAELSRDEITQMRALVRKIMVSTPLRRSRRPRPSAHPGARLDMRRTIRAAERRGVDIGELVYARPRQQPRRLVLLCDVSGSMEPYTRVFLSLLQGAVVGAHAEAFVFSTQLTRLTRQLMAHDPDQALAKAAASATGWASGTRIAESIRHFTDEYGRRGIARGAVVVVLSDGWAQDEPAQVERQMARLRRLAWRIVWVNPRKVAADYQPLVGGMAAALPFCDSFVSGHSYSALIEVADAIRSDRSTSLEKQRTH